MDKVKNSASLPSSYIKFGHEMKEYFPQDPNYININFGSFGSPPKYVLNARNNYTSRMDSNTDRWFRFEMFDQLNVTKEVIAKFVNIDKEDIVLVDNATEASNSILRSFPFEENDEIFFYDINYKTVKKTLEYLQDTKMVKLVKCQLDENTIQSTEKIIEHTKKFLEQHKGTIKFAIFDHIPSTPPFIMPINQLIPLFKEKGTIVAIDGAHAAGQIEINLKKLNPGIPFSNNIINLKVRLLLFKFS